jgi:2-dehydropantoate 2-reductase
MKGIGAGATGGYLGVRLAEADATFVVHEGRKEKLAAVGLKLRSPLGDAAIAPTLVKASEIRAPSGLVILAVKA